MIALAFSSSRSSMLGLIEGGKVFVNGKMVVSNGHPLKPEDIVSVRGYGKFRYDGMAGTTKKDGAVLPYRNIYNVFSNTILHFYKNKTG